LPTTQATFYAIVLYFPHHEFPIAIGQFGELLYERLKLLWNGWLSPAPPALLATAQHDEENGVLSLSTHQTRRWRPVRG
jgi:hypothetical protein